MKLRLFTGLACALALGGCASYGYVDDGGGYYSGGSSVQYNHVPGYGGYGYGVYGYGSPYYGYRYTPGWALGVGYGSPYYYPRHYGYPGGGYYRPPHHHPRPPVHPPRPGGQPDGPPPHADASPPLDRAPWRDLERIVEANEPRPPRPPRADAIGGGVGGMPRADGQSAPAPFPAQRPPRPVYQGGDRGPRYGVPAAGPRLANREGEPPRPPVQRERRTEARGDSRADGYSRNSTSRRQSATESTENP